MESITEELLWQHRDAEELLVKVPGGVGRMRREGVKGLGVLEVLRALRREIQRGS